MLRKVSFPTRWETAASELVNNGTLVIGRDGRKNVTISDDGELTNGKVTLRLQRCRSEGEFSLGTYWKDGRNEESHPDHVYASYEKSGFRNLLRQGFRQGIGFDADSDYGWDVVIALSDFYAKPGS